MVVVAIIGILAAIAIPNYQKYAARVRQSEAKVALSSVYTSLMGYFSAESTFTQCLRQIGGLTKIDSAGTATSRSYYTVGFEGAMFNTCGADGTSDCLSYAYSGTAPISTCDYAVDVCSQANAAANPTFLSLTCPGKTGPGRML
jgi:type II secretory pathway pseudopilin PulG